ncbi:hypothetical protein CMV_024759, partial [Castanea mollissima]
CSCYQPLCRVCRDSHSLRSLWLPTTTGRRVLSLKEEKDRCDFRFREKRSLSSGGERVFWRRWWWEEEEGKVERNGGNLKGRGKSHCCERMDCYRLGADERKVVGICATYVIMYDRVF